MQFVQDLEKILALVSPVGVPPAVDTLLENKITFRANLAVADPVIGFAGHYNFTDPFNASTISIGATYASAKNPVNSPTYDNEPSTHWGLSAFYPVTSYKDVSFPSSGSSNTLAPTSVKRQSGYFGIDLYEPEEQPQLTAIRWLPHVFAALPAGGKVLEHGMLGAAFSLYYVDAFYGAVFDDENESSAGVRRLTIKGTVGIEMSVTQFTKLVSSATSSTKTASSKATTGSTPTTDGSTTQ